MKIYVIMIGQYEKQSVLDVPSEVCTVYKVMKDGKSYIMHEFQEHSQADEYSFKVRKRLAMCTNLVLLLDDFSLQDKKYYVSEYMENDLLRDLMKREKHVYDLTTALQLTATLFLTIQQLHDQKLIYRNIRPEKIRIKDGQPFLYDFSFCKFNKRKERVFGVCGAPAYLAPQFFIEDGYGVEVDIWAIAVLLHVMLFGKEPFVFNSQDIQNIKHTLFDRCVKGYKLDTNLQCNPNLLNNKLLLDFFHRCFVLEPSQRLTIDNIKRHRLFQGYFPQQLPEEMLEAIEERKGQESAMYSHLQSHPAANQLLREAIIFDFVERTSEALMIDCAEVVEESVRAKASFAALKVGMLRIDSLIRSLKQTKPPFSIKEEEWEALKNSSSLTHQKGRLEKKRKILNMLFKSAARNVANQEDAFYREEIILDFNQIKIPYRNALMKMFEQTRSFLKNKDNSPLLNRKLVQNCVRLIILHLINRIFERQSIQQDFQLYFKWKPQKNLALIDEWIQTETVNNLKMFMVTVTTKYL